MVCEDVQVPGTDLSSPEDRSYGRSLADHFMRDPQRAQASISTARWESQRRSSHSRVVALEAWIARR